MDFNRIGNIIKKTKDKLIVATDTDLLVVMDLDSYEDLIKQNQSKTAFVVKDELVDKIEPPVIKKVEKTVTKIEEIPAESFEERIKNSGPISVKDVIADKAVQTFMPPAGDFNQVDESDEFFFEEVD